MQFKPNFDLLCYWPDAEHAHTFASNTAFVAVFRRDNKTLVYMCDRHCYNISFNMVDMCFADEFDYKPDVLLTEMPNAGFERRFNWHGVQDNTLAHAAVMAMKKKIPVVCSDLSDEQIVNVINSGFPDNQITNDDLRKVFSSGGPYPNGNIWQKMSAYVDMYGRDRFMLHNIAAALNKYDTVFAIFGIGHYEVQRLVLEDMMGKPEYITKIKNMRGDFSDVKIEPIKLCEFEVVKDDDKKS